MGPDYVPDVVAGVVRGFGVLVDDITQLRSAERAVRQMELQLRAKERLASMATLAAGVAHEINNPLTVVLANVELASMSLDRATSDPTRLKAALGDARDGAIRIRDIVRSMRLLTRSGTGTREIVDVSDALEQSLRFAANTIRYRARLVSDLGKDCYVDGSTAELVQVFVNLLANAQHALSEATIARNEIRVSARREHDSVIIEVTDNGVGIPDGLRSRIFDPFFTTKDVGDGMGLGLAVSNGIVTALGGTIAVSSQEGEGSTFRITLPASPRAAVPAMPPFPESHAQNPALSGGGVDRPRVLVVDDDEAVAKAASRLLEKDCEVTVVNGGRAALRALSGEQGQSFDAVLCDLMMPDLSGEDVYAEVTKAQPELARRFVFMTGGAFTSRGRAFLDSVRTPVLEKPFDAARVREAVLSLVSRLRAERGTS